MPHPLGNFGIYTIGKPSLAKKFVVWQHPEDEIGTLIVSCRTPKQAERYCEYLNAVVTGEIKIPRNRNKWS